MNAEGLADATAANPFRSPSLHPGISSCPRHGDHADRDRARQALGLNPEVPTQPLSDTSTVTPSGAVYFTSTLV